MTHEEFNQYCASFKAAEHVVQWGGADVWKVGGKVFAIGGWTKEKQTGFTFKTSDNNYHFLENKEGYRPAPYLASRGMKWIQQFDADDSEDEELRYYISESYKMISTALSKKKQRELGLL
ncbi:MmcQ/YjbR family DNA-binding protein [Pseudoteredinibacter isoporae]|uniref:Putative DNA-binding protein (MmcQ/YjbR family) n=1 Tax=Pseudoteredinibacter isoporae TaxID=570281 RepID=A0A7X0MWM3_9GAMM|nr:MmcQ/YjbR family DNA-binding protein [Pseudoteredinibacter isoporae]MBB6522871.1 putative DNA-binding protein (MmcQ/YjbR family) [Pseudoteredinibacter isoporae]NHO88397.1 MmcQ/YjbR family DNA-binding protein [Pseudoteredinibacter isoporae]NIB23272.1 MmcQ/YjbR family DNA-binding protein [Pseudoteredinibacter isoporae]